MSPELAELIWSGVIAITLIGLGTFYLVRERLQWRRSGGYSNQPPPDRRYHQVQYWRRQVGSVLLVFAGSTIFVVQLLLDWQETPRLFGWLWLSVLVALMGAITLAAADLIAIRRFARRHRKNLAMERQQMIARQLDSMRSHDTTPWRYPPNPETERN